MRHCLPRQMKQPMRLRKNVGKNAGMITTVHTADERGVQKSRRGESNFVNANGLHDDNHYTCARDMALIGREIWRYPEFLKICQEQSYTIPQSDTTEEHVFSAASIRCL